MLWPAAAVAVGGYWLQDATIGPFAAVRRYGVLAGSYNWSVRIPPGEWAWYATLWLGAAAAVALIAAWPGRRNLPPRRTAMLGLAVFAVLLATAIRLLVIEGAPLADDERVYLFQAQVVAGGALTAPEPPCSEQFAPPFIGTLAGKWFGQYGYGHPAAFAVGEKVGLPALAPLLLAGVLVLLLFALTRELFDERAAVVAALLAATSPLLVSTAATLLSQTTATALVLAGVWLLVRGASRGGPAFAVAGALALGAAAWTRPLEAALLGIGPAVFCAATFRRRPAVLAALAVAVALPLGLLAALQWRTWGDPLMTNYHAYWRGVLGMTQISAFGFAPGPWEFVHTPWAGLRQTAQNLVRLDTFLIGLPGALLLVVWGLRRRRDAALWAVYAGVPLTGIVLFFYFWPGLADTGPQLWHAAGALLLPATAAGLVRLIDRLGARSTAAVAVVLVAAVTFWPAHLGALHRAARAGNELPRLAERAGLTHAIVFADRYPFAGGHERAWTLGLPVPRPDLSDDVLWAETLGTPEDRRCVAEHFPNRAPYVFKVIDGKTALLPLDEYTGRASLEAVARPRDLPGAANGLR
jgi:Dolichyl-phosphate-mannose-protein mannosyltransferase